MSHNATTPHNSQLGRTSTLRRHAKKPQTPKAVEFQKRTGLRALRECEKSKAYALCYPVKIHIYITIMPSLIARPRLPTDLLAHRLQHSFISTVEVCHQIG